MNDIKAVKEAIILSTHHHIDMANEKLGLSLMYPTINFNVRGRTAGKANSPKWWVSFNMGLVVDNLAEFLNQVVPHEVAHLVTYATNNNEFEYKTTKTGKRIRVSHGARFYRIMRMFGVDETRCHKMDTSKVRVRQAPRKVKAFPVVCTGCGDSFTISTVRRNKILNGATYKHKCGGGRSALIQLTSHLPIRSHLYESTLP